MISLVQCTGIFPKYLSYGQKHVSKPPTLPFPPDPCSNAMQYIFPIPKMLRQIQIHLMPQFQTRRNIYLRDIDSNSFQVSSQCIADTTCLYHGLVTYSSPDASPSLEKIYLNSSAVKNNSPSLPLVRLSNVWLRIMVVHLRDADSWKPVNVNGSIGVHNVSWLGTDC
jgi:hypothetical protein